MNPVFSRRDFLKASGAGLLGFFLADLRLDRVFAKHPERSEWVAAETPTQGRIIVSGVELLSEPFFNSKRIRLFGRDEVLDIRGEAEGDFGYGNPFNQIWYRIGDGYAYSGSIQPVDTLYQKPVFDLPAAGVLGEVTVPFSDTQLDSSVMAKRGYRIYYSTTHWITGTFVNRNEKSIWYQIYDRQLQQSFYVTAHEMRVVSPDELTLLSPEVPEEAKRIYVDLTNQLVTAFEDEIPVLVTRTSTGDKGTRTPFGEFRTYHKGPSIHMTNQGDGTDNTYHLPGVPWVSFFTGTGVAFHGTYWHNNYGRPSSRGCVNLTPGDAKFIYRWTMPEVPPETPYLYQPGAGTIVNVA